MPRRRPALPRILGYLLLIALLSMSLMLWLDIIGAMDARSAFMPVFEALGLAPPSPEMSAPGELFLDQERLQKERLEVQLRSEEIDQKEAQQRQRQAELDARESLLNEREKNLLERELALQSRLQRYDNKRANLEQVSRYLTGMPPADAVRILGAMNDQDLIDVLRATEDLAAAAGEQSLVAFWLSLMARSGPEGAARAAEIQVKMVRRPD